MVQVNGGESIFESAVINEFVSEINPPVLHPTDLVDKARNRAWIEYGSGMFGNNYQLRNAKTVEDFQTIRAKLIDQISKVEDQIADDGPFFNGEEFSLIDSSYAPFFKHLDLVNQIHDTGVFDNAPKMKRWSDALLSMEAVKKSVVEDFDELFYASLARSGSYVAQFLN